MDLALCNWGSQFFLPRKLINELLYIQSVIAKEFLKENQVSLWPLSNTITAASAPFSRSLLEGELLYLKIAQTVRIAFAVHLKEYSVIFTTSFYGMNQ